MNRRLAALLATLAVVIALRLVDLEQPEPPQAVVDAVARLSAQPAHEDVKPAPYESNGASPRSSPLVPPPWPISDDPFRPLAARAPKPPPSTPASAPGAVPEPPVARVPALALPAKPRPGVFGVFLSEGRTKVFLAHGSSVAVAAVGERVFAQYRVESIVSGAVTLLDETNAKRFTLSAPQLPDASVTPTTESDVPARSAAHATK